MTVRWNPFALARHNQWNLPRVVHHAVHVLLGLAVFGLGVLFHWPVVATLLVATMLAWYEKHVWLDWHCSSGRFFHPWVAYQINAWDFASDLGLTLIGATALFWRAHLLALAALYYALSLVNDP